MSDTEKPLKGKNALNVAVGRRVRQLRNERGLKQCTIAYRLKCSNQHVGYMESGRNSLSIATLAKLCVVFGITLKEFFDFEIVEALSYR